MPDLDHWLAKPSMRVAYRRESDAPPERLWEAARSVRLADPGGSAASYGGGSLDSTPTSRSIEMFRAPPFLVLARRTSVSSSPDWSGGSGRCDGTTRD